MPDLNEDTIEQNLMELLISQCYYYFHGSSLALIVIKENNQSKRLAVRLRSVSARISDYGRDSVGYATRTLQRCPVVSG